MSEEGFLSRWSRRKRQARRGGISERSAAVPAASGGRDARGPGSAGVSPASQQTGSKRGGGPEDARPLVSVAEPEITAEELARLPRIEELTAETDLAQFLRKGVPAILRNAALRRIWALDPKIRDYVGEARDYAYDWNVPGGVPGSGAIPEADIEGLLRRVIGDPEPGPAARATSADQPSGQPSPAQPSQPGKAEPGPEPETAERRPDGAMPG